MRRNRIPSYRLHKASGQGIVTLNGKDHYLGLYNTPESHSKARIRFPPEYLAPKATGVPRHIEKVN